MTTNHRISDYDYDYASNEIVNRHNNNQWRNYSYDIPNNTGQITNRTKNGPYNVIEKDFGDHIAVYYVPSAYEDDYDISQLDERPIHEEPQKSYSPVLLEGRYYQPYDDYEEEVEVEEEVYIKELPRISPRRQIYVSPKRPKVIKRIYYEPTPTSQIIEYIPEKDYRPKNEEIVEYIVRDRVPRQRYVEESQPKHHNVYVESLPPITRSPRVSSSLPPIKPLRHNELPSPRRSKMAYETPQISPPLPSIKPLHLNELSSPRRSKMEYDTPRIRTLRQTPNRLTSRTNNKQKHISLKDIVAQNRAKRGPHIPKPRREVDEEHIHDLPTYNKNFVKNDFLVHK